MKKQVLHIELAHPATGVYYSTINFSAGEQHVRLSAWALAEIEKACSIVLTARIQSAADLVELAMLKSAVDGAVNALATRTQNKRLQIRLILPYLPGGRADRRFTSGDCWGGKVYAHLINAMGFDAVVTIDAHSAASLAPYLGIHNVSPFIFVQAAIDHFCKAARTTRIIVVLPDEGAVSRWHSYHAKLILAEGTRVISAKKKRDAATGKIQGVELPEGISIDAPVLIVDDLCDGGRTFEELLKLSAFDTTLFSAAIGLYTTVGIYSRGHVPDGFDVVYCTDAFLPSGVMPAFTELVTFQCLPYLQQLTAEAVIATA